MSTKRRSKSTASSSEISVTVKRRSTSVSVRVRKPSFVIRPYLHEDVLNFRKSVWSTSSNDNQVELQHALEEFCDIQTPLGSVLMLQVLYNIHKRITDEPTVDKYYRIYIKGTVFEKYVWQLEGSEKYLLYSGWIKCGNYIVLSKSYPIASSLKVIENVLRTKKRSQVSHSASDRQPASKRPLLNRRRARSNVGETVITEDEIVASYTNIESDSAADSGVEEEETSRVSRKPKLRRVESKEHLLGDEEYIVVDFIGNLEISSSSRKSSETEDVPSHVVNATISSPESAIGLSPPEQSPISASFENISISPTGDEGIPTDFDEVRYVDNDEDEKSDSSNDDDEETSEIIESKPVEPVVNTEPVVTEEPPKKTVYSAGKGLKSSKGLKASKAKTVDAEDVVEDQPKVTSASRTTPSKLVESDSSSIASTTSLDQQTDNSKGNMSRSSSTRSISSRKSDKSTTNSVLQNKLLFDQQIAGQFKRKPEIRLSSSQSSSRNNSLKDLKELPASGMVAGARSMFEATSTPVAPKKKYSGFQDRDDEPLPFRRAVRTSVKPAATEIQVPVINVKKDETSTKKKRFPFKKKKAGGVTSKKGAGNKSDVPAADAVKLMSVKSVDEDYQERAVDVLPPSIEVSSEFAGGNEKEDTLEEKKKKGGIFSKLRRRSRKSSGGESSDNDHEKVVVTLSTDTKLEGEVIEESEESKEDIEPSESGDKDIEDIEETKSLKIPEPLDLTLTVSSDADATTSLPVEVPDVAPPSPGSALTEVKSVLEGILDRKSSLPLETSSNEGTPKKKRLRLKKKSTVKVKGNVDLSKEVHDIPEKDVKLPAGNVVNEKDVKIPEGDVVNEKDVKIPEGDVVNEKVEVVTKDRDVISEDVPIELVVKKDISMPEWPEELTLGGDGADGVVQENIEGGVSKVTPADVSVDIKVEEPADAVDDVVESSVIAGVSDSTVASIENTEADVPDVTIETPEINTDLHVKDMDDESEPPSNNINNNANLVIPGNSFEMSVEEDDDISSLGDMSFYSNDGDADTVSVDTTDNPEKKKKKLKLRFPRRKSSKKNKVEKDKTPSPQKEVQIWEDQNHSKLDKKNSKKLKRPRSLNFLADVISPSKKTDKQQQQQRPLSITEIPDEQAQKSPGKKSKSLNFFKKKKKPVHISVTDVEGNENLYGIDASVSSPDVFKIPDVIDGHEKLPESGNGTVVPANQDNGLE